MAQQAAQPAMPKKASEAFKNVKVMGDIPADQWFDTMSYFDDALGVNCDHCHKNPFEADAKPEKAKARQMIRMVREMNEKYFAGERKVTCNSCHNGALKPVSIPELSVKHWQESALPATPLPDATSLIERYREAAGLEKTLTPPAEHIVYSTDVYLWQKPPSATETDLTSSGPERVRMSTQSSDGKRVQIRNGNDGWQDDGKGWKAMKHFQLDDAAREASIFDGVSLLENLAEAKTVKADEVHGHEAFVVEAKQDGDRVWLYFDQQTGLLLRERMFFPSFFADGDWDIEPDDYRTIGKIKLPYEVRILNPGGNGLTIRKVKERAILATPDSKLFEKPEMPN